jgi:hypothetical protein
MTKPQKSPVPSLEVAADIAAPLATEAPAVKEEAPPAFAKQGVTPVETLARLRVIDADTGDLIVKVLEADADAGHVVRFAVEGGALVRENDRFKTIDEERKIRIEWATGHQKGSF